MRLHYNYNYHAFQRRETTLWRDTETTSNPFYIQIREKEEKKKQERMGRKVEPSPMIPKVQSHPVVLADPITFIDQKEILQKQL